MEIQNTRSFKDRYSALKHFRNYQPWDNTDEDKLLYSNIMTKETYTYDFDSFKMGDFVLFRHLRGKEASTPILGCFINFNIWDQAVVFHYVEAHRAYHSNYEVITNPVNGASFSLWEMDPVVESIQFWTDDIIILGKWDHKPTFKELRDIYGRR